MRLRHAVVVAAIMAALSGMRQQASAAEAARPGLVAVYGDTVYTMTGPPIEKGVVLIEAGKIKLAGSALDIPVPPEARVLRGKVVTPGLVDAHTTVGLTGYLNQDQDQDQLDKTEPIQPELRAIDSYNPRERLIACTRGPRLGADDDRQDGGRVGRRRDDHAAGDGRGDARRRRPPRR